MEVCKCGHIDDDHRWEEETYHDCYIRNCECVVFEPASLRGHTGIYAHIEAAFDTIKEQVDAILAAEEDLVKRSSLAQEIGNLFVNCLGHFQSVKNVVDAEATASLDSK